MGWLKNFIAANVPTSEQPERPRLVGDGPACRNCGSTFIQTTPSGKRCAACGMEILTHGKGAKETVVAVIPAPVAEGICSKCGSDFLQTLRGGVRRCSNCGQQFPPADTPRTGPTRGQVLGGWTPGNNGRILN